MGDLGGAFYLNIIGDDDDSSLNADCLKVSDNDFSNNNDSEGNEVYLALSEGVLASFVTENWCADDPEICKSFTTSLAYLCMQKDTVENGPCDELQLELDGDDDGRQATVDGEVVTFSVSAWLAYQFDPDGSEWQQYMPDLYMRPGASIILEIFGWDNFGNTILTDEYDLDLNDSGPVIFTSKASKFDKSAWVLPLFVDKGSEGEKGRGALIDPNYVVEVLPYATLTVVPCDNGYYQQQDANDASLFTCTACVYSQYTMTTSACYACEGGMICTGKNETYIKAGYYGTMEVDESGDKTGRIHSGKCPDYSGLPKPLLTNLVGFVMIANFMRGGLKAGECPHPFMIYTSKSALYVFQLLPYLTFQSTIDIIAPIADFFSFST